MDLGEEIGASALTPLSFFAQRAYAFFCAHFFLKTEEAIDWQKS